jgi:hypothetical protein
MKKQRKSIFVLAVLVTLLGSNLFLPGLIIAGDLEPSAPPGPTMKTLNEIPPTWSQILPAAERFELVMGDEAVLDKETGLVWTKNANIAGYKNWQDAINNCRNLDTGNRKGWRLPTVEELATLVDPTQSNPALPAGHPFDNVVLAYYWAITTYQPDTARAWTVDMSDGSIYNTLHKTLSTAPFWPVRGGQ